MVYSNYGTAKDFNQILKRAAKDMFSNILQNSQ